MRANRRVSRREVAFRKAVWREGLRGYRTSLPLPGKPDIAFSGRRIAIFVNGSFWHRCPVCRPPEPRANAQFWRSKLDQNVSRDRRNSETLAAMGWKVVVVWEHEIRPDPAPRARKLVAEIMASDKWPLRDFNLEVGADSP
jgi:DNA mismatch endonuclease (patch repair protein)